VEIINAVRDLSRMMKALNPAHMFALTQAMQYLVATPDQGLLLKPKGIWDGSPEYEFIIDGLSDAVYANHLDDRKSDSSWTVLLNKAPTVIKAGKQDTTALSATESEAYAAISCVQDMLLVMRIIESIGLKVKKPMNVWIDNKGTVDLFNNCSVTGRTWHIATKICFIRELKEEGLLAVNWMLGSDMPADLGCKNLAQPLFESG